MPNETLCSFSGAGASLIPDRSRGNKPLLYILCDYCSTQVHEIASTAEGELTSDEASPEFIPDEEL